MNVKRVVGLIRPRVRHLTVACRAESAWPWDQPVEAAVDDGEVAVRNAANVNVYVGKHYANFKANWAENVAYDHATFVTPDTVEELQEVVAAAKRVSMVGSGEPPHASVHLHLNVAGRCCAVHSY